MPLVLMISDSLAYRAIMLILWYNMLTFFNLYTYFSFFYQSVICHVSSVVFFTMFFLLFLSLPFMAFLRGVVVVVLEADPLVTWGLVPSYIST